MNPPIVLLVEDEPIIATELLHFFEKRGCQTLLAADSDEAFSICEKQPPTLVVMNFLQKNAPDGMAFARRLRVHFPKVSIFFLTGARRQDLEASPDFFPGSKTLHKPFTLSQLKSALTDLLSGCPVYDA